MTNLAEGYYEFSGGLDRIQFAMLFGIGDSKSNGGGLLIDWKTPL